MRIIDLSQTYQNGMSQFPGQPPAAFTRISSVEKDGCQVTDFHALVHVGTHCDAPAHFVLGGRTIDNVPLDRFVGEAVVVDLQDLKQTTITPEHMQKFDVHAGDIVLFKTASWREWNTPKYNDVCPYFTEECAEWLVARGVRSIGLDFISPDAVDTVDSPVHHIVLAAELGIVENLRNLEEIKVPRVFFAAAPLKIRGGDGAYARAFAVEF